MSRRGQALVNRVDHRYDPRMLTARRLNNLREMRRHGVGRLLLLARRDFLQRLSVKMGDFHGPAQVWSRGRLLPYIDLEGTRSTELARRLGITKQAVAKAITELEEDGLLERVADEADGRAYLVKFTEAGIEYLIRMHDAITKVERDYENEFGAERIRTLKVILGEIAYRDEAPAAAKRAARQRVRPVSARSSAAG